MSTPPPDPSFPVDEPQQLLLSVLSSLPDTGVVVVDAQLILRFVCGPALERRGWDHAAVVGRTLAEVLGDLAPTFEAQFRAALGGETATLEVPGGAREVYRAEFLPLRLAGNGIAGAIAVVRDITQQVEDRAALARSEREFRLLAENATDMISRHDLDARFLYASPSVTALLGWTPDELVGRSACEMVHPADHTRAAEALDNITAGAEPLTVRYRLARRDGSWVWVETLARQVRAADGDWELHASTRDISVQMDAEAAERDAQERFRLAFDDAPIGMALVDLHGRFKRVNAALCALLERSAEELLSCSFQEITAPEDLSLDLDHLRRLTAGEIPHYAMEKRYLAPDGTPIWTQLSVSLLRDADGNPEGYISQIQDIRERRRMQEALQHLADHDTLSGLWNRRRFEEQLRREIARVRRHGAAAALLLFDLDGLKRVNDTYGHQSGDELIRVVSRAVRARLRETDAVARLGGDEFAILLPSLDLPAAIGVAEKICATVRELAVPTGSATVTTTASIGVAMIEPDVEDERAVLAAADRAMYAAKAQGGDGVAAAR